MLLATDLDRTLIPNGFEPDDDSVSLFNGWWINGYGNKLAYVSGRNLAMLDQAQADFGLKLPDFYISEVGTVIYRKNDQDQLVLDPSWSQEIRKRSPDWSRERVLNALSSVTGLILQEEEKQNQFKVSFYLKDIDNYRSKLDRINEVLDQGVATVVWSVDDLEQVGLVDVLPTGTTKAGALDFLRSSLGLDMLDVVYCGDSGNDITALTAGFRAIVVKNAREEVKAEVLRLAKDKGLSLDLIYLAKGRYGLSGNYGAGILEGLIYFGFLSPADVVSLR